MSELNNLREHINNIDEQLVKLLNERLNTVKSVAEYKKSHRLEILQKSREAEILAKITQILPHDEYQEYMLEIYAAILKTSKDLQEKLYGGDSAPAADHNKI